MGGAGSGGRRYRFSRSRHSKEIATASSTVAATAERGKRMIKRELCCPRGGSGDDGGQRYCPAPPYRPRSASGSCANAGGDWRAGKEAAAGGTAFFHGSRCVAPAVAGDCGTGEDVNGRGLCCRRRRRAVRFVPMAASRNDSSSLVNSDGDCGAGKEASGRAPGCQRWQRRFVLPLLPMAAAAKP